METHKLASARGLRYGAGLLVHGQSDGPRIVAPELHMPFTGVPVSPGAWLGRDLPPATLRETLSEGSLDAYRFHLKTGGEVRLGFPGAREQTVAFTDGRRTLQARDLRQAAELYGAGWELGSPGRPGVRVHFPGTRQEQLADPDGVFARPV